MAGKLTNVINPNGELVAIDDSQLADAVNYGGYRVPSTQEAGEALDQQDYGTGAGNAALAGLAGAGRAASFGLSDQALVRSGAVAPETLSKLAKYNPGATVAGEVAGVGAGLLLPELAGAGAAAEGAGAAGEGAGLLRTAITNNPVKLAARAAEGIKAAATPETSTLAGTILSRAGAGALGSSVEGAAYGLGESVSENALGDPDLTAEKVLSNIGHGALYGGALGGILEGAMGAYAKDAGAEASESLGAKAGEEIPSVGLANAQATDNFDAAVRASALPEGEKQGILDGLGKLRPNVGEIDQAADRLGVQAFPAQRSDSDFVQNRYGMATQSPSPFGVAENQRVHGAFEQIGRQVEGALGPAQSMSEAELGNALKKGITDGIGLERDPIEALYDEFRDRGEAVPVSEKGVQAISRNILRLEGLVNADGKPLSEGSTQYAFASRVANDLPNIKTLDDLKRYRTLIRQESMGKPELRYVAGEIQEKLSNLEERSIRALAEDMKTPQAKEKVLGILNLRQEANARYAALRDKMGELGEIAGKRKIYGPQDFMDFMEDVRPEKLAKKTLSLARNNSESLAFLKEQFPNEFNLVKQQVKNQIRDAAMENGEINLGKAIREVNKLSPEARRMFWDPKEIQVLKDSKTWYDAWPKKWGPSGTPQGIQYIDFFRHPASAAGMTLRDFANLRFANHFAGSGNASAKIAGLSRLERLAQKTTATIKQGAKDIFEDAAHATSAYAGLTASDSYEKERNHIIRRVSNPTAYADELDEKTRPVFSVAPNTSGSLQQAAIRASQFLHQKLPQLPPQKPFGPKMKPAASQVSKFSHLHALIEAPTRILDEVRSGQLTPESLEAVATVYPKLFQEMQAQVMEGLTSHLAKKNPEPIPYKTRLSLSLFLGQDLDHSTEQASIASNQLALAQMGGGSQGAGPPGAPHARPGAVGKMTGPSRMLTASQAAASRKIT